jgi:nucleotide-binding universal stress UspA family protein
MSLRIRKIICPIDFDREQVCGLGLPVGIARAFGAKLVFCHVADTSKSELRDLERRLEECVDSELAKLEIPDLESFLIFEEYVVDSPDVSNGIIDLASEIGAELIVLCSRHQPPSFSFLGSTSERVCRTAPCAVLLTDPSAQGVDPIAFDRLVVAYDFSLHSELALQYALGFAKGFGAELDVMHVLPETWLSGHNRVEFQADGGPYHEAMTRLRASVPHTSETNPPRFTVKWGRPYREILDHASETDADLILMGAHGADFGLKALFGSNVDRVVRQAGRMVLIAHPLKPAVRLRNESSVGLKVLNQLGMHG